MEEGYCRLRPMPLRSPPGKLLRIKGEGRKASSPALSSDRVILFTPDRLGAENLYAPDAKFYFKVKLLGENPRCSLQPAARHLFLNGLQPLTDSLCEAVLGRQAVKARIEVSPQMGGHEVQEDFDLRYHVRGPRIERA